MTSFSGKRKTTPIISKMENINFWKIEDNFNFWEKEDDLFFFKWNQRYSKFLHTKDDPIFIIKWKMTSIFFSMEDELQN